MDSQLDSLNNSLTELKRSTSPPSIPFQAIFLPSIDEDILNEETNSKKEAAHSAKSLQSNIWEENQQAIERVIPNQVAHHSQNTNAEGSNFSVSFHEPNELSFDDEQTEKDLQSFTINQPRKTLHLEFCSETQTATPAPFKLFEANPQKKATTSSFSSSSSSEQFRCFSQTSTFISNQKCKLLTGLPSPTCSPIKNDDEITSSPLLTKKIQSSFREGKTTNSNSGRLLLEEQFENSESQSSNFSFVRPPLQKINDSLKEKNKKPELAKSITHNTSEILPEEENANGQLEQKNSTKAEENNNCWKDKSQRKTKQLSISSFDPVEDLTDSISEIPFTTKKFEKKQESLAQIEGVEPQNFNFEASKKQKEKKIQKKKVQKEIKTQKKGKDIQKELELSSQELNQAEDSEEQPNSPNNSQQKDQNKDETTKKQRKRIIEIESDGEEEVLLIKKTSSKENKSKKIPTNEKEEDERLEDNKKTDRKNKKLIESIIKEQKVEEKKKPKSKTITESENEDENKKGENEEEIKEDSEILQTNSKKRKKFNLPNPPAKKLRRRNKNELNDSIEEECTIPNINSPKKKSKSYFEASENKIFKGFSFLVTGFKQESYDGGQFFEGLVNTIKSHGGRVIDEIIWNHPSYIIKKVTKGFPCTLLVSDSERRTLKYLLALASGTPCVNFQWVYECIEKDGLVPMKPFLLTSGYSKEKKENVTSYFEEEPYSLSIFKESRIEVVGSSAFKETWGHILKEAGAKVVDRLFTPNENRIDYIVSSSQLESHIFERASKLKAPLVTVEWVIQSLIARCKANPNALEEYYTFENIDGSGSIQVSPKKYKKELKN